MGLMMATFTYAAPIEATPVENVAAYTGSDPYVFDKATKKYYAYNNQGAYEEYGIITKVGTLKVAGGGATEIAYIKTNNSMGTIPYINLNYIPKKDSRAYAVMTAEEGADWKAAYGCGYYSNGWKDRFCFFTTNATIDLGGETGNREVMRYGEPIETLLDASTGKMEIFDQEGTLIGTIVDSPKDADCKTPLYVFAQNKDVPGGGTQTDCYNPGLTLYLMRLYEGGTLVMDLVPVVDSEGKGGLKDKLTGIVYTSANGANFELSPDGQAIAAEAGITVYPGKLVVNTTDNHEYKWNGTEWEDLGAIIYKQAYELGTDYCNLSNWSYPGSAYDDTFGVNVYNESTGSNLLSPYEGKGGWEPLSFKLTHLTVGDSYRVSFNYSGKAWHSWSSYTTLPFFVLDNESMPDNAFNNPSAALGYTAMPNTETINQPYSADFTAAHGYALMCIQFGVVDDGGHDPAFEFGFDNIIVERISYPEVYEEITWTDTEKYTPLAYIESTSATRDNVFEFPYKPTTNTQVNVKFWAGTTGGWRAIFSARNIYAGSGMSLYINGNDNAHIGYFTGGTTGGGDNRAPFTLGTEYVAECTVGSLRLNGENYETGETVCNATSRNFTIFANPENDQAFHGRIWYFQIIEDGKELCNYKPVMRHDGAFGYYDAATSDFVQPKKGYDGYTFQIAEDQAYVYFPAMERTVLLGATANYQPATPNLENVELTWKSADESIATVAADGTVTGKAKGTVEITCTTAAADGWAATYTLEVQQMVPTRVDKDGIGYMALKGGEGGNGESWDKLCDNNPDTKFCGDAGNAWVIIMASEPVAVKQYSFVTGGDTETYFGRNPKGWKLEGSNDQNNWTVIDEQYAPYYLKNLNKEEHVFTVNDENKYQFFKFTPSGRTGSIQYSELWINEQPQTFGEPIITMPTCAENGKTVITSDLGVTRTMAITKATEQHQFNEEGKCAVCGLAKANLVHDGQATPYYVRYKHAYRGEGDVWEADPEGWTAVDYDDSDWDVLKMPIGSNGYGVQYNIWCDDYNNFWMRREFYSDSYAKYTLRTLHDDNYKVYLNGQLIHQADGWTDGTGWVENPVTVQKGKNVIAVYIQQNWGGAYCDFGMDLATTDKFKFAENTVYGTYVAPFNIVKLHSKVQAFTAEIVGGGFVKLNEIKTIPAGEAVVLKDNGSTHEYQLNGSAEAVDPITGNDLKPAYSPVAADGTQYILAKLDDVIGFAKATPETVIPAGKGYLVIASESGVKAFYPFTEEDATGISEVNDVKDFGGAIYNLSGQRVNKAQKGIYIINGKKVLK